MKKRLTDFRGTVSGLSLGDLPGTPGDDRVRRHVLRYEVTGETVSLVREARAHIERQVGHSLSDDDRADGAAGTQR